MHTKSLVPDLLKKTRPLKEVSNVINVMAMYYDPKVWYNNDLIFNFINKFIENFRNRNGKVEKSNG